MSHILETASYLAEFLSEQKELVGAAINAGYTTLPMVGRFSSYRYCTAIKLRDGRAYQTGSVSTHC